MLTAFTDATPEARVNNQRFSELRFPLERAFLTSRNRVILHRFAEVLFLAIEN